MIYVYKLEVSDEERHWPIFEDREVGDKLAILPDPEVYDFIDANRERLSVRLWPNSRKSPKADLKDCDLYQYGNFPIFSERAILALAEMRGLTDHLAPITAQGRSTPYYLYFSMGKDLIGEKSEFKIRSMIGGRPMPLFLVRADFHAQIKLDADVFWILRPGDQFHLRETFVTSRFKDAWENAKLIGARFTEVGELPS